MYFIRYQPLKEHLRSRTVTDQEALPYLILFCVLEILVISFPVSSELNKWNIIEAILNVVITIIGLVYVYRKNGGSSGYDIIHKLVVLGWVVVVRYFIVIIPIGIIVYLIAGYFGKSGNETTLFDIVFFAIVSAIYYERLGRHIADTNNKNSEQGQYSRSLNAPADAYVGVNNMMKSMLVKIIILVVLLFSMSVSSCSDTSKQNKAAEKPQFKTKEEAIKSTYNSFLYEKTVCPNFVSTIAEDKEFIKTFESIDYRERESGKRVFQMLSKSKVAKNEVIQYVLRNSEYFLIDVDFHGGPGMTYVKDSPIFCAQTDKRLKEIENLGPSEQAWKVREYYLNFDLENLLQIGMPWSEGGGVSYDFNTLRAEVDTAKKLYSQQFKEPLKGWVQKASTQLKEKSFDPASELPPNEQQLKEVESWIIELNKGL